MSQRRVKGKEPVYNKTNDNFDETSMTTPFSCFGDFVWLKVLFMSKQTCACTSQNAKILSTCGIQMCV